MMKGDIPCGCHSEFPMEYYFEAAITVELTYMVDEEQQGFHMGGKFEGATFAPWCCRSGCGSRGTLVTEYLQTRPRKGPHNHYLLNYDRALDEKVLHGSRRWHP